MSTQDHPLLWLEPGQAFPDPQLAWDAHSPAPGLVAAGAALDTPTLLSAYRHGIFPWFGPEDPPLWWSPDPRMCLRPTAFHLRRSLRQTLRRFATRPGCEIRMDTAFHDVISACAGAARTGQNGTWIVPAMVQAYVELHQAGWAHSVETWIDGELVGGLYLVAVGRAVFGESMFMRQTDASKIALAALVALCQLHEVPLIDCQQNTRHLASLGASEIPRQDFLDSLARAQHEPPITWLFEPIYWNACQFL